MKMEKVAKKKEKMAKEEQQVSDGGGDVLE
jgi:hypothetical protein